MLNFKERCQTLSSITYQRYRDNLLVLTQKLVSKMAATPFFPHLVIWKMEKCNKHVYMQLFIPKDSDDSVSAMKKKSSILGKFFS